MHGSSTFMGREIASHASVMIRDPHQLFMFAVGPGRQAKDSHSHIQEVMGIEKLHAMKMLQFWSSG